ncbi:MAG: sugar ABC transporter substrate-binding protein [Gemmatimonadetes bacterium]|nr:sugar ABC transporter substrate-binding protein [Gemmatimonadota bacterium]MYC92877.1 sugar ABC transporter substrate-binding protein [Gemmatimonadota bacterium]MYG36921.1 sugar ABC transporter substrate-binding protein [Gemmatimonadota bacterium]
MSYHMLSPRNRRGTNIPPGSTTPATVLVAALCSACAPTPPDTTTLRVALWAGGHELEIEQQVAARYEELRPGTRVLLESAPNGYEERLLTSIAAGHPPDVYLLDSPDIPTFVDRGLALDFAPYREALGFRVDSVFPQVLGAFVRGDAIFALPKDFTPMVLYANRGVLARAGIELPPAATGASPTGWTWNDFRRAARAVTADTDGDGRSDVFGFDFPRNLYQWVPFVWSAGGDILAPDATVATGYLDAPPALAAYEFLTGLAEDGLTPGAQFVQQGDPAREARFASGHQAFLLSGHWTLPVFRDLVTSGALDLVILPIPHHPSQPTATSVLYASGWAVPPNAANPRRAIDLAGFLASPEAQRIRARSGLAIPSRIDVAAEIAAADTTGVELVFTRLVEGARPTWGAYVRDFSRIESLAVEIMDRRLLTGEPLASSAADIARRVDEVLAR